jgi:hypothetical protein
LNKEGAGVKLKIAALLLLSFVLVCVSCGDDDDDTDSTDDDVADDDDDDDDAAVDDDDDDDADLAKWILDRPYLQNRSLWSQTIDMANPVWPRELGCIAIGNGKTFGIVGNQYPLAGWHNMGGPDYQADLKWFSDKTPFFKINGRVQSPDFTSSHRVRNSAIVIVEAENEFVEWTSVNFAPIYPDNVAAEQSLISVWIVRNVSGKILRNMELVVNSTFGEYKNGALRETSFEGDFLTARPIGHDHQASQAGDLSIPIEEIFPGYEAVVVLPYVFTGYKEKSDPVFEAIETAGVDALLESTLQAWNDWASQITVVETPDEKFNDLIRGLAVSIKINQAETGGVSEMNQYSHSWLRDIYGPAIFYPLIGLVEDYEDMIDYMWGATLVNGRIANAVVLDLDISDPPEQPDWDSMPTMTGRTRAESPSVWVMNHETHYRATGDLTRIEQRWGMLKHAVLGQMYVDGCLLHFSTDETFEDLMEVAFSENFLEEPDYSTLSLYSSLLVMRAAGFLSEMAGLLGYTSDETLFADLADDVENCMEDTFWMEWPGRYAVKAYTASREPHVQPYEDVNTMPLWLNALPVDDERVVRNFESTLEILGHSDGLLYSPIGFPYNLLFGHVEKGVLAGMSHGYWLNNLDKMFHPMASTAFDQWRNVFSETGFTDEAVVVDDFGHMQILREPTGFAGDISSRFRSWESGVMGYAFLYHLLGMVVDVPAQTLALAPQIPTDWPEFAIRGLAYDGDVFDVEVSAVGAGRTIAVETGAAFDLLLTVPIDGDVSQVLVDGAALSPGDYTVEENAYGITLVKLQAMAIGAGERVEVEVTAQAR